MHAAVDKIMHDIRILVKSLQFVRSCLNEKVHNKNLLGQMCHYGRYSRLEIVKNHKKKSDLGEESSHQLLQSPG